MVRSLLHNSVGLRLHEQTQYLQRLAKINVPGLQNGVERGILARCIAHIHEELTVNNIIDLSSENPIDLQLQEQALSLSQLRAKWNASRSYLVPVITALTELGIEPKLEGELNVNVTGDAKRLAQCVRIFMTAGFKSAASKPKKGDTSWYSYYKHPDCLLDIWFHFTSSVCKRVQVGTKLEEVPVYETRCDDITSEIEPVATPEAITEAEATELTGDIQP